jgi:hypothetical protein
MAMYEKFRIKVWLAPLSMMYHMGVHLFKHKISSVLQPLRYAAQIGEETGNIEESITCELSFWFLQIESRPLFEIEKNLIELQRKMSFYGLATMLTLSMSILEFLQILTGSREKDSMTKHQASDGLVYVFSQFFSMMLAFIFGDHEAAASCSYHIRPFSKFPFGGVDAAFIIFYDGLVAVAQAHDVMKRRNLRYGKKKVRQLTYYAKHSPELFLCRLYLLEAEVASATGSDAAQSKYISAIAMAKDSGSFSIAAHGNELAGRYLLRKKQDLHSAKMFFQQALNYYEMWGARTKVTQLTIEIKQLFHVKFGVYKP